MGEWGYSLRKPDNRKLTELLNEGYSFPLRKNLCRVDSAFCRRMLHAVCNEHE